MEMQVSADILASIWTKMQEPLIPGRRDGIRNAHLDILREGWAMSCDIQDILWETDGRADDLARHNDRFSFLLSAHNLHFYSRFRGPFGSVKEVMGHKAMAVADVAAYVMEIERLGFSVDAEPVVASIRPALLKQKYLTNSQLSVVWYPKQRHHCQPVIIRVGEGEPDSVQTITMESGYKATALLTAGSPTTIRVDAPNCRKGFPLKFWINAELRKTSSASLR